MKRFLVCIDGSEHSKNACYWLCLFVQPTDSVIIFYGIKTSKKFFNKGDAEKAIQDADKITTDAKRIFLVAGVPDSNITIVKSAVEDPRPAAIQSAKEHNCQFIFSGSRGQNALLRTIVGSFSEYLICHSPMPVFVVHKEPPLSGTPGSLPDLLSTTSPDTLPTSRPIRPPLRCLLAVDDSRMSHRAADSAGTLLGPTDHLDIVTVRDFPQEYDILYSRAGAIRIPNPKYAAQAAANKAAYTHTLRTARHIVLHGPDDPSPSPEPCRPDRQIQPANIKTHVIDSPTVRDALGEYIKTGMFDLAIVGTRQLGAAKRLVMGSVSHYLVHETALPAVLLCPG